MSPRLLKALIRANEVAFDNWMESTRLEDAFLDDPFLHGDEDAVSVKYSKCDCPRCRFHRSSSTEGRAIQ